MLIEVCLKLQLCPKTLYSYDSYAHLAKEAFSCSHSGYACRSNLTTTKLAPSCYILRLNEQFDTHLASDLDETKVKRPYLRGLLSRYNPVKGLFDSCVEIRGNRVVI